MGHHQKLMTLCRSVLAHHRKHLILTKMRRKHVAKHCRSLHIVIKNELHHADLQFLFSYFHSLSCYFNFRNTAWSAALCHICAQWIVLTYQQHRILHSQNYHFTNVPHCEEISQSCCISNLGESIIQLASVNL